MLFQIRDGDCDFVGDPLDSLKACEQKIAYEADMGHGNLFYVTNAESGHVVDTYKICEHFECVDNISCENCLGYPNCPLHERLKRVVAVQPTARPQGKLMSLWVDSEGNTRLDWQNEQGRGGWFKITPEGKVYKYFTNPAYDPELVDEFTSMVDLAKYLAGLAVSDV